MAVTYKKLWHILIEKKMKKKDLEALAGIPHYAMNRDENVTTETIEKICKALGCSPNEIMDFED